MFNKFYLFLLASAIVLFASFLLSSCNDSTQNENEGVDNESSEGETSPELVWGVDSASITSETMYACVQENFGVPAVWGRYLVDKDGVSFGLTEEEVQLLHENDSQILVIWNHFTDATTYEKGQTEAEAAIVAARQFGIPEGVALFADVEPNYPVDHQFLLGWYETLGTSKYESGVYGIFDPSRDLFNSFEQAAQENASFAEETYVWTAAPNVGITTESNAPAFNPEAPENAMIAGWQYGIDAEACNIDTNIFSSNVYDVLW